MVDESAQIIWDYMLLKQQLVPCDAIFILGSVDERVGSYGAELYLKGFGRKLIISGGQTRSNDQLAHVWSEDTEAEHFKSIAIRKGVPERDIIIENKATNTGENIEFTYKLLENQHIKLKSVILIQKPYMERRTFATFSKQWPDKQTQFLVSSPPIEYVDYFIDLLPKEMVLNTMVGDLQRIKEYSKLGFQIQQEIPDKSMGCIYETS